MADIIQLLPDSIANQIAAGEVVQRPASVVKELLENAIDAGGTHIKLIIKEAGKQLIQVIDNGVGMSTTDARMSFERHATSKIRTAADLNAIRTLGFRGEALASIAAVAQVDLKSKKHGEELGTHIVLEGSDLIKQESCETPGGTNLQVKNLFFNVPARRKFLKSNTVELRHIIDEFQRVAIAHPDIMFEVFHNNVETYHLPSSTLRKRVVNLFGKNMNDKLVPIEEETDLCKISGFIGKPEAAKRSRGEQFFLINGRFIKSPYLNHAVVGAYEEIIPAKSYPFYLLALEMDPERIDINVHPTKQEIKFEDERLIYNIVKAAVRHALSQYNIAPSLDFDQSPILANIGTAVPDHNTRDKIIIPSSFSRDQRPDASGWENMFEGMEKRDNTPVAPATIIESSEAQDRKAPVQLHLTYILSQIKSGFMLIDQQYAHERILYERNLSLIQQQKASSQRLLFPKTYSLSTQDTALIKDLLPSINALGFEIEEFGKDTFIIHGIPAHLSNLPEEASLFDEFLEQFKLNVDLELSKEQRLALSLARSGCIKRGVALQTMEMEAIIDQLFACNVPYKSPTGKKCFITFELDELQSKF